MKVYLNENINMRIIRYFADKYPNAIEFVYQEFSNEIRKLKLQDFVFSRTIDEQEITRIAEHIKTFDVKILEILQTKAQNNENSKDFCKKNLARIVALIFENLNYA